MFTHALLAIAAFQAAADSIVIPDGPLTIHWNQSANKTESNPTGAGSAEMDGADYGDKAHLWRSPWSEEYFVLNHCDYGSGMGNQLLLNSPGGLVISGRRMAPQDPQLRIGFVLTNARQAPFMLEYTSENPVGSSFGQGLVITITQP